jgi:hypothetical protein
LRARLIFEGCHVRFIIQSPLKFKKSANPAKFVRRCQPSMGEDYWNSGLMEHGMNEEPQIRSNTPKSVLRQMSRIPLRF